MVPPPPLKEQLSQLITELAASYDGPVFEPHATLLGSFDSEVDQVIEKMTPIVAELPPLNLELGNVSFSTTFFQSVFVRVNSTAPLMELNLKAKEAFGVDNDVFMPHISLLYGDHPMKVRHQAVSQVSLEPAKFIINELTITPGDPDISNWRSLGTIPFGSK